MSLFWFELSHLPVILLVIILAFTFHEFGHAWTAYKLGDDTAYMAGRVTLNPMAHIDWFGFLLLIVAGFGWAKPVPVRESRLRRPYRLSSILVTAMGPFMNLVLAFIGVAAAVLVLNFANLSAGMESKLAIFFGYWIIINLNLLLFNLIPVPPLDGYRIAEQFLPLRSRFRLMQYEQWVFFIFLLLVFIPPLRAVTLDTLFSLREPIYLGMQRLVIWILHLFM